MFICSKCKIDISELDGAITTVLRNDERLDEKPVRFCPEHATEYLNFPSETTNDEVKAWIKGE